MTQKFPFKNLVFKGGGVKAFAYKSWIAKGILVPIKNMGQHPYWFLRAAIEELRFSRNT